MDVHKGLKWLHLLCATDTRAPLGALSAQTPTLGCAPEISIVVQKDLLTVNVFFVSHSRVMQRYVKWSFAVK